jgi:biopolymer transport protein TolR
MAMAAGGGRGKVKSEINVTPLVDVVLVLLIIFMVVTPMLQRGKDVKLPTATKQKEEDSKSDPMIVSITSDKKIFLEKDPFDEEGLRIAITGKLGAEPFKQILLKGDSSLTFEDVRKVLSVMQKSGAKTVKLGVQEKQK